MHITSKDLERLVRAGAEALQRGDAECARNALRQVTDSGHANSQVLLLLAHACLAAQDHEEAERAIGELLRSEPANLRGLIIKGNCRARADDRRAASSFYRSAIKAASAYTGLPPDLAAELQRIELWLRDTGRAYRDHLEQYLEKAGVARNHRSARFDQSLSLLFGEKQLYIQQPSLYHFPELPQRQFFEREEFDWATAVENASDAMVEELRRLLAEHEDEFSPYLLSTPDRPRTDFHGLLDNPDWSTFYLYQNGAPVEGNVAICPLTYSALQNVPLPRISTRAPAIFFSRLRPGARIPAHSGSLNARLICHLPLIVPPGCGFRVGNEVREWEIGKLLIFDDTIEHEAWNDSDQDRVVLIFDIWRPELSEHEKLAITAMFEAVDSF